MPSTDCSIFFFLQKPSGPKPKASKLLKVTGVPQCLYLLPAVVVWWRVVMLLHVLEMCSGLCVLKNFMGRSMRFSSGKVWERGWKAVCIMICSSSGELKELMLGSNVLMTGISTYCLRGGWSGRGLIWSCKTYPPSFCVQSKNGFETWIQARGKVIGFWVSAINMSFSPAFKWNCSSFTHSRS